MRPGDDGVSLLSFSNNTSKNATSIKVFNPEHHPHERGTVTQILVVHTRKLREVKHLILRGIANKW